jgi:glycosyltransferase involved in cell wall biosynthesis
MSYSALITYFNSQNPSRAIESASRQTLKPQEIIVVDDCSSDDYRFNLEQLAKDFGCIYIRTPTNLGPAGARNLGIGIAKTNFIVIYDDDDISLPHRAQVHIENLSSGSQVSYVSSRKIYSNEYSFEAKNVNYVGAVSTFEFSHYLLAGRNNKDFPKVYVPASCLAFRKDSFDVEELFDHALRRLEDVDFALRASERGMIFSFSGTVGVTRYSSEGSDKSAIIESAAQIQILSKYRRFFTENEFNKMKMWYQIRAYYFSKDYVKLAVNAFLFTLRFGLEWGKFQSGLSRILHDFRKSRCNLNE